jgi:hypothetical protein
MTPSLIHEPIRKLPLWQDGFTHGQALGLRIALDALTAERIHQDRLADDPDARSSAACRAYADRRLLAVMRVIAGSFRQ